MWIKLEDVGEGTCNSCGAEITWVENLATMKRMPLDGHDLAFVRTDRVPDKNGDIQTGAEVKLAGSDPSHVSHFATCPQADSHRRN